MGMQITENEIVKTNLQIGGNTNTKNYINKTYSITDPGPLVPVLKAPHE